MRAVVCRSFGPVDQLDVVERPTPVPQAHQVLIDVGAAGVSFVDGLVVQGRYQVRPPLPFTPGSVAAGTVSQVGADVVGVAVGDRVARLALDPGAYASHLVVDAGSLIAVPDGVDAALAATAVENYSTVLFAVSQRVVVSPGDRVVVLGAGGGIGLAAVDVVRSLGARVLAVASTPEKRAAALAMGAEQAIGYDGDLKAAVREATGGGADVVVDPVGGDHAEPALRALAPGGRYCVLGFAAGTIPRLPTNVVLLGNRSVVGVDWGHWAREHPGRADALAADVLQRVARGDLHPPAPSTHPLADAGAVLALFDARAATGKHALVP